MLPLLKPGIVPINKPAGKTSFSLVHALRRITNIDKIGHGGTLDPFATGVMILLIGRTFTSQADTFLTQDKEYEATVRLGVETTTYDPEGEVTSTSDLIPSLSAIEETLSSFQGTVQQIPPMFSAKKIKGKKLYELARKGIEIERQPVTITLRTELLSYIYPELKIRVTCSKGTYIRSIAYDMGKLLGTGAHLSELKRTRCGTYLLQDCLDGQLLF